MCTAITYQSYNNYFGRNFDYEISYNEMVTITPRKYPLVFRKVENLDHHYAIIGITADVESYPLYYDAMNEKGLCIAGLNFLQVMLIIKNMMLIKLISHHLN
ncbi:linear amide C-N hydrolase [Lactiplantibacillus plantarum]